jgi:hypothetical protein
MEPLDFDFLKDRYDFELQRKDQLTTALALPVGVLGGLGSLLAVMVRSLAYKGDATTWVFAFTVVAAVCAFFACMVQLARAYHRQKYKFLPLLKELDEKLQEWRDFYQVAGYPGAEQDFFVHGLRTDIIAAADRNTENNDARSSSLYWARVWLFWLLGFATAAGIAYVANQVRFHA